MKNLKYIIAIMAAVTITASFGGCKNDEDSDTDNNVVYYDETNKYVSPEDAEKVARENAVTEPVEFNQQAELSGCTLTAKKVVPLGVRPADAIYDYSADMLAIEVELTNNTEETLNISALNDFYVSVDDAPEELGHSMLTNLAATKIIEDYQAFDFDVEPGQTVSGYVTLEAKTGWKEVKLSYTPLVEDMNFDAVVYTITPDMVTE